jgi:hemerythrin-like domain-containing protein
MQARGLLMIEHRLIERMIALIDKRLDEIKTTRKVDPLFVETSVDFIRIYADRTHHGKEEDILFRDLNGRQMSADDQRLMQELIEDHVFGRKTTRALEEANTRYRKGDAGAWAQVAEQLAKIVDFYPRHIEKEDKVFFPAIRNYIDEKEDRAMLDAFHEFDRKMIHEKYKAVIDALEKK